jgi:tRNA-binding EMAP/Myf-like protein
VQPNAPSDPPQRAYQPLVPALAPRDFGKGLVSEGMLLAAESDGGLSVLAPDGDAPAGAPVR